jgi:hypothetical protein
MAYDYFGGSEDEDLATLKHKASKKKAITKTPPNVGNATKTMISSSRRGKIRGHHKGGGYLLKVAFAAAIIGAYFVALKIVIITVMLQTNDEASQQQQQHGLLEGVKQRTRSIDNIILNDDNQDSSAANNFTRFMSYGHYEVHRHYNLTWSVFASSYI